jgi:hypothetical protein
VDPDGAQTDTFIDFFWAAIAISLQYTPAPPRRGGYSWVRIMNSAFCIFTYYIWNDLLRREAKIS